MLLYQQCSSQPLPRGLYVAYLKLKSYVDQIHIMVPDRAPNVLPHVRIRDIPNVTKWVVADKISLQKKKKGFPRPFTCTNERRFEFWKYLQVILFSCSEITCFNNVDIIKLYVYFSHDVLLVILATLFEMNFSNFVLAFSSQALYLYTWYRDINMNYNTVYL